MTMQLKKLLSFRLEEQGKVGKSLIREGIVLKTRLRALCAFRIPTDFSTNLRGLFEDRHGLPVLRCVQSQ
jgi:hypothetical protein